MIMIVIVKEMRTLPRVFLHDHGARSVNSATTGR